jgi:glutamine synthetase
MTDVAVASFDAVTPAPVVPLAERLAADGVRFILATFVDLDGRIRAKLVPRESLDRLTGAGLRFSGYAAGQLGRKPSDPDLTARPDPTSYMALPFISPDLAMVQCDLYQGVRSWPYSPRAILRAVLELLARQGQTLQVGAEMEYFLVRPVADGRISVADSRDTSDQSCYDARGITRMYGHLTEVSAAMNQLGWSAYSSEHEDANGQFEQNFTHAEAMVSADRIIAFRHLVSVLAERRELTVTFMPKPFGHQNGSGLHLHISLWRDGSPLFPDDADPRGLGLSTVAYHVIGGLLDHASALLGVVAPTVNSYKRLAPDNGSGRTTWAPLRASYSGDDRHHLVRVPDGNRIEFRASDSAANPYLAMAVVVAAALDGMGRGLDPGEPGTPGKWLPPTLMHAIESLLLDPTIAAALDSATDTPGLVSTYYAQLKRQEFMAWHHDVSDWEVRRYLTAI